MSKFKHPPRNIDVRPDFVMKDNGSNQKQDLLNKQGFKGAAKLLFPKTPQEIEKSIYYPKTEVK